jgi:hypothetical protein
MSFFLNATFALILSASLLWNGWIGLFVLFLYLLHRVYYGQARPAPCISQHLLEMKKYKDENADKIYAQAREGIYKRYLKRAALKLSQLHVTKED